MQAELHICMNKNVHVHAQWWQHHHWWIKCLTFLEICNEQISRNVKHTSTALNRSQVSNHGPGVLPVSLNFSTALALTDLLSYQLINKFSIMYVWSREKLKCAGHGLLQDQSWETSVLDYHIWCSQECWITYGSWRLSFKTMAFWGLQEHLENFSVNFNRHSELSSPLQNLDHVCKTCS